MNLFTVLLATIKSKITPIWTKIKLWKNPSFIKTRIVTKARTFFTKTLSVKPRNKKDYYAVFGWLISKKLAFAIVLTVGVASMYYLTVVNPISAFRGTGDAVKIYSYKSIPLRFTKGKVKIKSKSGYIAYEGNVENGQATGNGTLYNSEGDVVYAGTFQTSKYNGAGKEYYPGEILKYTGNFANNLYDGEGSLYRRNGTKAYEGAFSLGMKEGVGTLFDSSGKEIYQGNFSKDQLLYSDLLGKKTADITGIYKGSRMVYTDENYFSVLLRDIDAVYTGAVGADNLDDSIQIDSVYVLNNSIYINGQNCTNITELDAALGEPIYEGNSPVIMPEAVAIRSMSETESSLFSTIDMELSQTLDDVATVDDFDREYLVYLYTYRYEDLIYTFFTNEKYGAFGMYQIEKDENTVTEK